MPTTRCLRARAEPMQAGGRGDARRDRGRAPGRNLSAKRKRKVDSPAHLLRQEVIQAIQAKDPAAALAAYDAALAAGMRMLAQLRSRPTPALPERLRSAMVA